MAPENRNVRPMRFIGHNGLQIGFGRRRVLRPTAYERDRPSLGTFSGNADDHGISLARPPLNQDDPW